MDTDICSWRREFTLRLVFGSTFKQYYTFGGLNVNPSRVASRISRILLSLLGWMIARWLVVDALGAPL